MALLSLVLLSLVLLSPALLSPALLSLVLLSLVLLSPALLWAFVPSEESLLAGHLWFGYATRQYYQNIKQSGEWQYLGMIIPSKNPPSNRQPSHPCAWSHSFRSTLYKSSLSKARNSPLPILLSGAPQQGIISKLLTTSLQGEPPGAAEPFKQAFCSYIPLRANIQIEDQLINSIPLLRNLREAGKDSLVEYYYTQIRKFIQQSRGVCSPKSAWRICKARLISPLDILSRLSLYLQTLQAGSEEIFSKFGEGPCLPSILFHQLEQTSRYFGSLTGVNPTLRVSVELGDQINETSISKTMKMLYCRTCLIYDCGKHQFQDLCHEKQYRYRDPANQISDSLQILSAATLLRALKRLQGLQPFEDKSEQVCSPHCYKGLNPKLFSLCSSLKSRVWSPLTESLIKIGVHIFSFNPCLIAKLLFDAELPERSSCSVVFALLVQQGFIETLLSRKKTSSEEEMLEKETLLGITSKIQSKASSKERNRMKKRRMKDDKFQQVVSCCHYFIGEEGFDDKCANCSCATRGFCLPECQCSPECRLLMVGCGCRNPLECQGPKCVCFKNKTQCIPGVCKSCNDSSGSFCGNSQIQRRRSKLIHVSKSQIVGAGLGAFAGEFIPKNSLVAIYCGEVIDQEIEHIREMLKENDSFYNFGCYEGSTDARYMGNRSRFINHASQKDGLANLMSIKMFSRGLEYIAIYALTDIQQGQELYFDYDVSGNMGREHGHLYPFLRSHSDPT